MASLNDRLSQLSPEQRQLLAKKLRQKQSHISPRPAGQKTILSFAQQRMWLLYRLDPDSEAYNFPCFLSFQGDLKIKVLERVLNEIVRRHEILRSRFPEVNGEPTVKIIDDFKLTLEPISLENLDRAEQQSRVQQLASQEAKNPFDITQDALIRGKILTLDDHQYVLLLTLHHIIFDGWSEGVFKQELESLYDAFSQGKPSPLPELSIQYADFAHWERQWLTTERAQTQLDYWSQKLAGMSPLLELPTDRPRPAIQTDKGDRVFWTLGKSTTENLRELSQKQDCTLFMTLMAAFQILLFRYSGQEDIAVGTPIASRIRPEIEGIIGYFANTLILRETLSDEMAFNDLVQQIKETALAAYNHQDIPFDRLVQKLQPTRNTSFSPLFQVVFALRPNNFTSDTRWQQLSLNPNTAKFDLEVNLREDDEELTGYWEYNTDLFNRDTIERMCKHFTVLLAGILKNPAMSISLLPLLTNAERHQLLIEWNNTATDYPKDKCIHELFGEQVSKTPDVIAVSYDKQSLSYCELNQEANQLAQYLQSIHAQANSRIGICLERSNSAIVAILGVLKVGCLYVPLDPHYPTERLQFMVDDAQISIILSNSQTQYAIDKLSINTSITSIVKIDRVVYSESQESLSLAVKSHQGAYINYTSGSTGVPKGVLVPHRGVIRLVRNTNYIDIRRGDRVGQAATLAFDMATLEIWGALLNGGSIIGIPKETLLDPWALAHTIQREHINVLVVPTAVLHKIAETDSTIFSTLKCLVFGGEAASPHWIKRILKHGAPQSLVNGYGPTENTAISSAYVVAEIAENATTVLIGKPISNSRCYVLDKNRELVPIGVPGELYVAGDGLANGYLFRPQASAEKFILHEWEKGNVERLYRTGDLVRYHADGNLEFVGRQDSQVKIRGFRIE
ncbi:MAG: amino acid adenylation domain-containing protein, partial [Cyanobacteria bacterium P01_H01_bin.15]